MNKIFKMLLVSLCLFSCDIPDSMRVIEYREECIEVIKTDDVSYEEILFYCTIWLDSIQVGDTIYTKGDDG